MLALVSMGLETALAKAGNHAALHYACHGQSPERTNEIVGLLLRDEVATTHAPPRPPARPPESYPATSHP